MNPSEITLYSGGARGAEAAFGAAAAAAGAKQVTYTFDGHHIERTDGAVTLTDEALAKSDISMEEVGRRLGRDYTTKPWMRRILQSIWHQVNEGYQVFVVGSILSDGTVKGGTGWAAELAKMYNRPLSVFDQDKGEWFTWKNDTWVADAPTLAHYKVCGTGTRNLTEAGKQAIEALFAG